ncbi:unnamed protein product [Gongylonema pulchrum]|uniref:Glyco_trans_2-like domain-containing protein n=1 Tax=Gongylonema pulchrum TaxID=637853 RepID=A0A183DR61_9BILA|nr:unnamed protein product [Gongylonema pulchrum]
MRCKYWHYPEDLPTASVVIAFHNEGWSPLMRTVHSVLLRSPPQLLKEIIMVDDFSDKAILPLLKAAYKQDVLAELPVEPYGCIEISKHLQSWNIRDGKHLKDRLDNYLKQFNGKVRLVRNTEREGLIRTRSIGAKEAAGDVVIFLDAHCEVNINWLPPLLAPIRQNRKVMTVPVIDGIDMNTWSYRRVYGSADRHFRSPTHAGGLFAIEKNWFEELGYYDPGLQIWGGEQYELSFKAS